MEKGFIVLSRAIFDSAIWRDNPHVLKLFIYLLGVARYKKTPKKYPHFEVNRGEILTSLNDISEDNEYFENKIKKWSRSKVSRMLQVLEEQGYITKLSDTYGTHLSICNYDHYQTLGNYVSNSDETGVKRLCNGSEHNSKQDKQDKQVKKEKKYSFVSDIPESLLKDFLKIRTAKKAPLTKTAWNGIIREAKKAGITTEEAVIISVERNWQGFNADWINKTSDKNNDNSHIDNFLEGYENES